jgi:hypothetical protein
MAPWKTIDLTSINLKDAAVPPCAPKVFLQPSAMDGGM